MPDEAHSRTVGPHAACGKQQKLRYYNMNTPDDRQEFMEKKVVQSG